MPDYWSDVSPWSAPGNPSDCLEWSIDLIVTENLEHCVFLIDHFTTSDYIILGYCVLMWIIIPIIMCSKLCRSSQYPAIQMQTYEKILKANGCGMFTL